MKKILAFLLALVLLFSLAGCGSEAPAGAVPTVESIPETTAEPVQEITITTDNWQEYFEQRESQRVQVNAQGSIIMREFGYGVFLKEEYVSRLAQENPVDVSFDMQANSVRYQVYGDLTTNNFIVRDDTLHNEGTVTLTAPVEDLRGNTRIQEDSDFHDAVAAFFTVDGEFGA